MRTLLTPDEVAALLQVPVATLAQWRHRRTGPDFKRVGRHVRYAPEAVESWLADQ